MPDEYLQQALADANTWVPVAFFSFIEDAGDSRLHQLWVTALGNTEWRPVESRNLKEISRAYAECRAHAPDSRTLDLDFSD